ncbi:MAG: hypothetical protein ACKPCM_08500 [Pseudanabaena sp.]
MIMKNFIHCINLVIIKISIITGTLITGALPSFAQVTLTEESQVGTNGIGSVLVGQTVAEAVKASGLNMEKVYDDNPKYCTYFKPVGGLDGVNFMVSDYRIVRVDIDNPRVTTFRGAKIGDSEERIKYLYQGQIQVQKHPYRFRGHYLVFIPKDQEDSNYRVIFETDGQKVVRYRAGKLPEVGYIEGCS